MRALRVLHTADWHLGHSLGGKARHEEFTAFLDWLLTLIDEEKIDILLVAGDIFDSTTPGNRAQTLYYEFLNHVNCRHCVIIGGNHDSPSLLNAPRELLRRLNIHVLGNATLTGEEETLVLKDASGEPLAIVCAVPYPRDRDIRAQEFLESAQEKQSRYAAALAEHYALVARLAEEKRARRDIPVIAMGHLYIRGSLVGEEREFVGNLEQVKADIFPPVFDYVALGHLHKPQEIKNRSHIRYSGSPLPLDFSEANDRKSVCLVEFRGRTPQINLLPTPVFQELETISGDLADIRARLAALKECGRRVWLEINYEADESISDLRGKLNEFVKNSMLELLLIRDKKLIATVLGQEQAASLREMTEEDVLRFYLAAQNIPEEQTRLLLATYREALQAMHDDAE